MRKWVWRGLVAGGVLYVVALIPSSIRPNWNASPFRKPDQTIVLSADHSESEITDRIANACRAAWPLRPLMGSAHHVRVVFVKKEKTVNVREFQCETYVQ